MTPRHRISARRLAVPVAALLLLVLSAGAVLAADEALDGKLRTGDTITIAAGETVEGDLYAAAGTVTVDGTVNGDLVVAGGDIRVNGTVSGDIVAAGGTVTIAGSVVGDARIAGGQLTVGGQISEDLLIAGGQAAITAAGSVGEDLIAMAGQLTVAGSVAGSIHGGAGTYERTGSVGGTENVAVSETADDGDAADDRDENLILDALRHYVTVVLIGALSLWLMPRLTRAAAELIRRRPLASLGGGLSAALAWLLGLIGVVLVTIIAALVLGLISFGALAGLIFFAGIVVIVVFTFLLVLIASYLADALVGLALAGLVRRDGTSRWVEFGMLAGGSAAVVLVTWLPVVGGWLKLIVVILGLGGLALAAWNSWRARRAARSLASMPSEA